MTRVMWQMVKDKLILPYLDMTARLLRPRAAAPRRDRRPGHDRRRRSHQAARGRRQVRHHHAEQGPGRGIRPQEGVEEPQRHHPRRAGRHRLPRADPGEEHAARLCAPGRSPSTSAVTPTATCTRTREFRVPGRRARPSWSSPTTTGEETYRGPSTSSTARASSRASTTPTPPSPASPRPASPTPSTRSWTSGSAPRTRSRRPTTPAFAPLRRGVRGATGSRSSRRPASTTSSPSSTTRWPAS